MGALQQARGRNLALATGNEDAQIRETLGMVKQAATAEDKRSGYRRAIFSGFTTNALAEIIVRIIAEHPDVYGVWHMASEPISRFELLSLVKQTCGLNIQIEPDETVVCDRSIVGAENIVQAIREKQLPVETVVGVSTGKACKPVNVMGMTKAIQERIFIGVNMDRLKNRFICVRYGNMLGSCGRELGGT